MRNFLVEKPEIKVEKANDKRFYKKLKIEDIEKFYLSSMKSNASFGLEYERLSLRKSDGKNADYKTVSKIIEHFSRISDWELVLDNKTIIGAKDNLGTTISLEPGCQLEISLKPYKNINDIDLNLSKIITTLDKISKLYDVIFLPYGINPSQSPDEIELLNKQRYKIMNNYLPNCSKAELCTTMMRKTAGMQVNIDYSSKKDAYLKLKFFNLISPFVSGLCANSPFNNNTLTENKSNRVNVWLYTGENRCNLFYYDIFNHGFKKFDNVFKNYINEIIDVPMVYIERDGENIPINGLVTFREFMKEGFADYHATIEDYILHQSLCFPDVRLKQYIEIRNHDSNTPKYALMLCALYKGLSKCNMEKLLKRFNYIKLKEVENYYKKTAKFGLDFEVRENISGWDIIVDLFNIAKRKLNTRERCYLEPLVDILKFKKTPADYIIDSNISNTKELIEFLY